MEITDSILTSVKKLLGIDEAYEHFDTDIIIHINSVFATLTQLGVGPSNGYSIHGKDETWHDYIGENFNLFANVKSYIYLKVRLLFDPPISSAAIDAIREQIKEYEFRLFVTADPPL